jgi:hypothetical protein
MAAVAVDALNERGQAARAATPVAILNVGSMHRCAQQQAKRIDENVALAIRDLLARIEARVERRPLFARLWCSGCRSLLWWGLPPACRRIDRRPSIAYFQAFVPPARVPLRGLWNVD